MSLYNIEKMFYENYNIMVFNAPRIGCVLLDFAFWLSVLNCRGIPMGHENLRYLASESRSDDLLNPKPTKKRGFVVSLNYKLNQITFNYFFWCTLYC
jgi:hypothetical protein